MSYITNGVDEHMVLTSYVKSIFLFDKKKLELLANDEKATVPAIIIVVITAIVSTFQWLFEFLLGITTWSSWLRRSSNGLLISAFGNFLAVLSQVFFIMFFMVMVLHFLGITVRFDQYLRIFGFTQLWNLIGYLVATLVVLTEIPHGILFMDLILNNFPRSDLMPLYRFCYRYFQIFGVLSLISFLYGVNILLTQKRTSEIPLVKHLSNNRFVNLSLLLLVGGTFILSLYIFTAYDVSYCQVGEWELIWPSIPPGKFFPWPTYPSLSFPAVRGSDNLVDFILFTFFIQTGYLLHLTVLLWALILIIIFNRKSK